MATILTLRLGYTVDTPETQAVPAAVVEWRAACARDGNTPTGDPVVTVDRDHPEHTANGQYIITVEGPVRHGDV